MAIPGICRETPCCVAGAAPKARTASMDARTNVAARRSANPKVREFLAAARRTLRVARIIPFVMAWISRRARRKLRAHRERSAFLRAKYFGPWPQSEDAAPRV